MNTIIILINKGILIDKLKEISRFKLKFNMVIALTKPTIPAIRRE